MELFSKEDFNSCMHNPLEPGFYDRSERLQEIAPDATTMAYIIMVYDPQSPIRKEFPELPLMKLKAADLTGFVLDHELDDSIDFYDCVIKYLKYADNRTWASIVSLEATVWEMTGKLLKPVVVVGNGGDKDRLAGVNMKPMTAVKLTELNELLDSLTHKFYSGDDTLKKKARKKRRDFSSEGIAKAIKEQEDIIEKYTQKVETDTDEDV